MGSIGAIGDSRVANLMILRHLRRFPATCRFPVIIACFFVGFTLIHLLGDDGSGGCVIWMAAARLAKQHSEVLTHESGYPVNQVKYIVSATLDISL